MNPFEKYENITEKYETLRILKSIKRAIRTNRNSIFTKIQSKGQSINGRLDT